MKIKYGLPLLYTLLFAIYAPLALLSSNLEEISATVVWRPLVVCLIIGATVFLFFWLVIRNVVRACLITSIFLLIFFSYGHVYTAFNGVSLLGISLGKNRYLLPLFGLVTIFLIVVGIKWRKPPEWIHTTMLVVGFVLVAVPLFNIGVFSVNEARARNIEKNNRITANANIHVVSDKVTPDIYFIVLDAYTRQDALKSDLKYDNSSFLEELKKIGFAVVDCSRSNYSSTIFSLPSTLNMDYLDVLNPNLKDPNGKQEMLNELFRNPKIRTELANYGYKWVAFDPGRKGIEMDNADIFLQPTNLSQYLVFKEMINDFEDMLLRTTPGIVLINFGDQLFGDAYKQLRFPYYKRAVTQLFILDTLPSVPVDIPGPKFVYAHIMLPHYPYMFTADGQIQTNPAYLYDPIPAKEGVDGYRNQLTFINNRIIPDIKAIIANSKIPPIIIVEGDHGMEGSNRLKNLEAYYFPESLKSQIYPTMTPVNSFRIILNGLFDRGLPLLDDASYSVSKKYIFTEVKEDNPACIDK